jgi:DNA-binding IclR family transcriptional regulator
MASNNRSPMFDPTSFPPPTIDPTVAVLLGALLGAHHDPRGITVPRLRKQLGLPQSVLMRTLSTLIDAKLVELLRSEDQNLAATLTDAGLAFARQHPGQPIEALRKTLR